LATNNSINSGNLYSAGNGYMLIGQASGPAEAAIIQAGAGISVTAGTNSLTIATTGEGNFVNVITSSQTMAAGTIYMNSYNTAGLTTFTFPATAAVGDQYQIIGNPAVASTGWKALLATSGQVIYFGGLTSTTATGYLASTLTSDKITFRCTVANTSWVAYDAQGNITVV